MILINRSYFMASKMGLIYYLSESLSPLLAQKITLQQTQKAHAQILTKIENGNYLFAKKIIISPLGILEKTDGGIRIIHDCSRPLHFSVNDHAGDVPKQIYQTIDDAAKLVTTIFVWPKWT